MKRAWFTALSAIALALPAWPAHAALRILACEPEWGALAGALGGDLVDVAVATSALQDPHQIQAKPSLIARTRSADLVVCTGAELEIGWLPVLLQQSGNAKVQVGQPGNFAAADYVRKLEGPSQVDRSQGDVHASGNPHIQTDPRNIALASTALGARLAEVKVGRTWSASSTTRWVGCLRPEYSDELGRVRVGHPRPCVDGGASGARDPRAPGRPGAGPRHRIHRPGDRPDRRPRRDC